MKNCIPILIVSVSVLLSCVETGTTSFVEVPVVESVISMDTSTRVVPEAISLQGLELLPPEIPLKRKKLLEDQLAEVQDEFDSNPDSIDNIIWLGRRLAYLYQYQKAIKIYTDGIEKHPDSYRLLRHRAHRYISIRKFPEAIHDLERASFLIRGLDSLFIEPDGQPNKQNIPLSNTQFNIWYHLGLANYLQGNFDKAISAYKKCLEVSVNNDLLVATTDWLYMTYRKTGNDAAAEALIAPITKRMKVIENNSYRSRILMYKGEVSPNKLLDIKQTNDPTLDIDLVTQGYGVANWYLYNGELEKAREILQRIVQTNSWSAFGYIAAEVDLFNLQAGGI